VCLQLGRLKDKGTMRPQQVSLGKRANCDMAPDTAREARRLLGANGIRVECPAMGRGATRAPADTCEGTHDIHGLTVGQDITGLAAYEPDQVSRFRVGRAGYRIATGMRVFREVAPRLWSGVSCGSDRTLNLGLLASGAGPRGSNQCGSPFGAHP